MTSPKPPTQTAGVVGIEPKPIELTPAPTQRANWRAIAALPPFQMFVAERKPMPSGCKDSQDWATRAAQEATVRRLFEARFPGATISGGQELTSVATGLALRAAT